MHNASKVLLGTNRQGFKKVTNKKGAIAAGLAVRQKSDETISTAKTDGELLGISFGADLSKAGRTNICRAGLQVPILLTEGFTPVLGTQVQIDDVTGMAKAAGTGVTGVNATYASGPLTAMKEDGTEVANGCALIDMVGGL